MAGELSDFWQMKAILNLSETLGHNNFVTIAMSFFFASESSSQTPPNTACT
jgi:hypothetical protein